MVEMKFGLGVSLTRPQRTDNSRALNEEGRG